jgi:ParB family chromosome partitioning protein
MRRARLASHVGGSVTIDHRANGGGMSQVRYRTLEQLDDVIRRLESGPKIDNDA